MRGLAPVAALRFREALAGRILWLLPLHFVLALALARGMPGPTADARREAADAAALALAAALGLAAAAVMGASPLPAERERARGALVLAAPAGPAARVLGTAIGAGAALLLLVAALGASSLAAVEVGGGPGPLPRACVRAASLEGGNEDPAHPGLHWLVDNAPRAVARFAEPLPADADLLLEPRARVPAGGEIPALQRASVHFVREGADDAPIRVRAPAPAPFRVRVPAGTTMVKIDRERGSFELGLRVEDVRFDAGRRPRALSRGLHALALFAGLAAAGAAAIALSTVTGTGVAAAGSLALSMLALFRSTFADAAVALVHAGAMERAIAAEPGGNGHGSVSATPPALAPLFRTLADLLPDGTRFDLGAVVAANEVPDPGDAGRAALAGIGIGALFLALAVLGARRRP